MGESGLQKQNFDSVNSDLAEIGAVDNGRQ